jgi:flagellar biosynthetic protein FlhB
MPDSTAEKTEQPTSRRLRKAKEVGNLPMSTELLSAVTLITLIGTTALTGPKCVQWFMVQIKQGMSCQNANIASPQAYLAFINEKIIGALVVMMPFFIARLIAGIATNIAVAGGYNFSIKSLEWKLSKINPVKGFKKLFSTTSLVRLIFSIVKIIFVATIVVFYLRDKIESLATMQWAWSIDILTVISKLILGAVIRLCIGLLIVGIIDMIYQKYKYIQKLKMTKQEVKDERKNQEGPPEAKRRIRQKQFEISMRRMLQDVPDANVVLVNPTHVAVALKYDPDNMPAPIVVAKGADHVCEKIKDIARAYGVPIIRRPELARNLFATVDLGHVIPLNLFTAVAEVMALIYRLKHAR